MFWIWSKIIQFSHLLSPFGILHYPLEWYITLDTHTHSTSFFFTWSFQSSFNQLHYSHLNGFKNGLHFIKNKRYVNFGRPFIMAFSIIDLSLVNCIICITYVNCPVFVQFAEFQWNVFRSDERESKRKQEKLQTYKEDSRVDLCQPRLSSSSFDIWTHSNPQSLTPSSCLLQGKIQMNQDKLRQTYEWKNNKSVTLKPEQSTSFKPLYIVL